MTAQSNQSFETIKWVWRIIAFVVLTLWLAFPALADETKIVDGVEIHPVFGPIGVNDHRMPFHLDSIIALGLLAYALAVAILLNHSKPTLRVAGVWGAAFGSLAIAATIIWLQVIGALDTRAPALLPFDQLDATFLRVMAAVFAIGGVGLAFVAIGQSRRTDVLTLGNGNEPSRYGRRARYFHWTIAILFILLIPMGIFTSMIPKDQEYHQAYYVMHKSLGLTVLILAGFRVAWLIANPAPKLDSSLSWWEKFLAHGAHYALYFFLFAFPISGILLGTYAGKFSHFYFWDLPLFLEPSTTAVRLPGFLHKVALPYLFYLVILGHIAGALKHQFIDKHRDAFRRMVT
ncbi:MAG: cytochrome b [Pseudomonadota bacterium]